MTEHTYSTAAETAAAIASGDVSSRELLEAALARVDQLDGPINAVVALDAERPTAAPRFPQRSQVHVAAVERWAARASEEAAPVERAVIPAALAVGVVAVAFEEVAALVR